MVTKSFLCFAVAVLIFGGCTDSPIPPETIDVIIELRNLTHDVQPGCLHWPPTSIEVASVSFSDKNAAELIMSNSTYLQPSEGKTFSIDVAVDQRGIVTFEALDDDGNYTDAAYDQFYQSDGMKYRFDYYIHDSPSSGCYPRLLYKGTFPI